VSAIETRDFARYLSIDGAFLQIKPLIGRDLPLPHSQLSFHLAAFPVELENDERPAFHLAFAIELIDLLPVQQQFANPFRGRNFVAGAFVRLNVGVVKKRFAVFDSREGIADVCLACPDRFDLATLKLNAGFITLENTVVAERLAINDGFARHTERQPSALEATAAPPNVR
jgi:hypothetical protein